MTFWKWSSIAANNGTADSTAPWPEGMSPSAVNDSARGNMAALAKFRDDSSGALIAGGTPTAYTLTTNQGLPNPPNQNQLIAFVAGVTNGAGVTLSCDGGTAYPIQGILGTNIDPGVLVSGTPYVALLRGTAWLLHGFYGSNYNVPLLGGMDYWGTTAPNSSFILPAGQAISRTTYPSAFAAWGTTYGVGDGSTTFGVPDVSGRVRAMREASPSRLTSTYFGGNSTQNGATGGGESHLLTLSEVPAHSHANVLNDLGHTHNYTAPDATSLSYSAGSSTQGSPNSHTATSLTNNSAPMSITNVNAGGGGAHAIVQPTIVCGYIIRVL